MQKSKKSIKPLQILSNLLAIVLLYIVSSILSFLLCMLIAKYVVFNDPAVQNEGRVRMALGIGAVMFSGILSAGAFGPLMTFVFYDGFGKKKKSSKQKEKAKNVVRFVI